MMFSSFQTIEQINSNICNYFDINQLINTILHLKSLEMKIKQNQLELIIRFISKHIINNNSCLYLLAFQEAHSYIENWLKKFEVI